jgi:archaellum component FlaG (FlaF/FlaG flagellin family)
MRPGISRVVVEIIILVIAVALALLIFSPISGYIFGSLGRTATVGGATSVQALNVNGTSSLISVYVKNLGPGTITLSSASDFQVYVDGTKYNVRGVYNATTGGTSITYPALWKPNIALKINAAGSFDTAKQHSIVVYGPGGTQTQYLYYPPPS